MHARWHRHFHGDIATSDTRGRSCLLTSQLARRCGAAGTALWASFAGERKPVGVNVNVNVCNWCGAHACTCRPQHSCSPQESPCWRWQSHRLSDVWSFQSPTRMWLVSCSHSYLHLHLNAAPTCRRGESRQQQCTPGGCHAQLIINMFTFSCRGPRWRDAALRAVYLSACTTVGTSSAERRLFEQQQRVQTSVQLCCPCVRAWGGCQFRAQTVRRTSQLSTPVPLGADERPAPWPFNVQACIWQETAGPSAGVNGPAVEVHLTMGERVSVWGDVHADRRCVFVMITDICTCK